MEAVMRPALVALVLLSSLAACSPAEEREAKQEAKAVLADVKEDASKLTENTGDILKKGAGELKEGVQDAGDMLKDKSAEARDEAKDDRDRK
jgi:hypothetical protein